MQSQEDIIKKYSTETIQTLNALASLAANTAKKRGKNPNTFGQGIADILDELSETLRELYHYYTGDDGKPEGYLVELADVVIATLSLMHDYSLPGSLTRPTVGEVILKKMMYNLERPD